MRARTRYLGDFHWEGVASRLYKAEAAGFRDVVRQVLADAAELPGELRYFEVAAAGRTTLERHEHAHTVVVLRGRGRALVGEEIVDLRPFDVVCVGRGRWHQFRASPAEPLGFLCLVAHARDRPVEPDAEELRGLRTKPRIAAFLDS